MSTLHLSDYLVLVAYFVVLITLGKIASKYTANLGYPGYSNAAVSEIFNTFLVPQMFAEVAQGKSSPQDAARSAQSAMQAIFKKWKDAKKI